MSPTGLFIVGGIALLILVICFFKTFVEFLINGGWVWMLVIIVLVVLAILFSNNSLKKSGAIADSAPSYRHYHGSNMEVVCNLYLSYQAKNTPLTRYKNILTDYQSVD